MGRRVVTRRLPRYCGSADDALYPQAERDERLSAEMEAAHRAQTQLVPADLPVTPNFQFEAAYPPSEVGGDFYQIFPRPDGSVLVAIGDVSGKGLKAAMLGTLVVGALRALAQEDLPPSGILSRLNAQLAEASGRRRFRHLPVPKSRPMAEGHRQRGTSCPIPRWPRDAR